MPGKGHRVTDADRRDILRLHSEGLARNKISEQLGWSQGVVSSVISLAGLAFDGRATERATRARAAEMADMRARLAYKLLATANEIADDVTGPYRVYNFGGKDNVYNEQVLDRPPAPASRDMMTAVSTAMRVVLDIGTYDGTGAEPERALLSELGRALGIDTSV